MPRKDKVELRTLVLGNNPLSGTLPLSLTNLTNLRTFWFDNTDLCEPLDPAFQAWLLGIGDLKRSGCTNVAAEQAADIPADFALEANYPNPFNAATLIRYALPQRAPVHLSVYDVLGRQVRALVSGMKPPGTCEVSFEAAALPSGIYFYRLSAGPFTQTRRMVLAK